MAVFHYSRVSTDDQTVENQKEAVRCISGITVDHWYADEGVSGGIPALQRPQFSEMMKHITAGDVLVVSSVDRIGRNTIDVLTTVENFQKIGVKIIVLAYGNLDLTSDMGQVVLSMAAAFAQLERASLKTRTKAGLDRTKAQGTILGAVLKIKPKDLCRMVEMYNSGTNINAIAMIYSLPRNTVDRNIKAWGTKLEEYTEEYTKRQNQMKDKKKLK